MAGSEGTHVMDDNQEGLYDDAEIDYNNFYITRSKKRIRSCGYERRDHCCTVARGMRPRSDGKNNKFIMICMVHIVPVVVMVVAVAVVVFVVVAVTLIWLVAISVAVLVNF